MKNDVEMVETYYCYFNGSINKKNFRNETILHIAAKYDSIESLQELVRDDAWVESLLEKNFMGDTPIHTAAKKGNKKILKFFLRNCP